MIPYHYADSMEARGAYPSHFKDGPLGPRVGIALAGPARLGAVSGWSDQLRAVLRTRAGFVLLDEPEVMPFPGSGAGLRPAV